MPQRVNYDQIAHLYDEPFRDHPVDANLLHFLSERPDLSHLRILDTGCGTGKQLTANRRHFPEATLVGLDLFRGMLLQAQKRGADVSWVNGDSSRQPLKSNSFDYITNQLSYHHGLNKRGIFEEIYRVLKPGGRFVLNSVDPWVMQGWAVYHYFPAAQQHDFHDFLPTETLTTLMQEIGFARIQVQHQPEPRLQTLKEVLEFSSQRTRSSQFILLTDEEYMQGIERIKADIQAQGEDAVVDSTIVFLTMMGDKA